MTRRYTEEEVSLIIKRALEPDPSGGSLTTTHADLTLDQIKEIAAEVGIDPARIERAAFGLAQEGRFPDHPYVGIPTAVNFLSTIEGKRPGEVPVEEVVAIIRSTLGRQGIVSRDPDTLEWKARDPTGGRYVSITPAREGIRLSVLGNYRDGLLAFMAGAGGTTFVGAAAVLSGFGLGPAGILLGAAAVALIPPRFAYRWWRRKEDATMASLHGRLLEVLSRIDSGTDSPDPQALPSSTEDSGDSRLS